MKSFKCDLSGPYNKEKYIMKRTKMVCEVCKEKFPKEVLEFHHPLNVVKNFELKVDVWRGVKGARQETLDEADKCAILCSNCHKLEHVALKNGESIINDPSTYRRYRNHRVTRYESLDDWYDERSGRGTQLSFSI